MNVLSYRGYTARVEFDGEDRVFFGRIAGIRDIVSFHGASVAALEKDFQGAVDDYLATCKRLKQSPNKPYSGKLMLRVPPEVHAHAATQAEAAGKSLNQWAAEVLARAQS